jgi:hypothetical protein
VNDDGRTVAAMDVLAPGIGEVIGGSQHEERHRPRQCPRRDPVPENPRQGIDTYCLSARVSFAPDFCACLLVFSQPSAPRCEIRFLKHTASDFETDLCEG